MKYAIHGSRWGTTDAAFVWGVRGGLCPYAHHRSSHAISGTPRMVVGGTGTADSHPLINLLLLLSRSPPTPVLPKLDKLPVYRKCLLSQGCSATPDF